LQNWRHYLNKLSNGIFKDNKGYGNNVAKCARKVVLDVTPVCRMIHRPIDEKQTSPCEVMKHLNNAYIIY
jgi:hypothetical protein